MKGLVKEIPNQDCSWNGRYNSKVAPRGLSESQICAIGQNHRGEIVDSCRGDSGGPLHEQAYKGANRIFYVKGIVSHGSASCQDKNIPGVRKV